MTVVLVVLGTRVRTALAHVRTPVQEALRPTPIVTGLIRDRFRSREERLAENALLRQRLLVASSVTVTDASRRQDRPPDARSIASNTHKVALRSSPPYDARSGCSIRTRPATVAIRMRSGVIGKHASIKQSSGAQR